MTRRALAAGLIAGLAMIVPAAVAAGSAEAAPVPVVRLDAVATTVTVGSSVQLRGSVVPTPANSRVDIEMRVGSAWQTWTTTKTRGRFGTFTVTVVPKTAGEVAIRARVPASGARRAAVSPVRRFQVTDPGSVALLSTGLSSSTVRQYAGSHASDGPTPLVTAVSGNGEFVLYQVAHEVPDEYGVWRPTYRVVLQDVETGATVDAPLPAAYNDPPEYEGITLRPGRYGSGYLSEDAQVVAYDYTISTPDDNDEDQVRVWHPETGVVTTYPGETLKGLSTDGRYLFVQRQEDHLLVGYVRDLATGELTVVPPTSSGLMIGTSPNGRFVVALTGLPDDEGSATVTWDRITGDVRTVGTAHEDYYSDKTGTGVGDTVFAVSDNGRYILYTQDFGTFVEQGLRLYDTTTDTSQLVSTQSGGHTWTYTIIGQATMTPDGETVAYIDNGARLRLWHRASGAIETLYSSVADGITPGDIELPQVSGSGTAVTFVSSALDPDLDDRNGLLPDAVIWRAGALPD